MTVSYRCVLDLRVYRANGSSQPNAGARFDEVLASELPLTLGCEYSYRAGLVDLLLAYQSRSPVCSSLALLVLMWPNNVEDIQAVYTSTSSSRSSPPLLIATWACARTAGLA